MEDKNIIKFSKELLKNPKIRVFSKMGEKSIYYIVSLDAKEESTGNNERIAVGTFTQGNPKDIKENIKTLLKSMGEYGENYKVDKRFINNLIEKAKQNTDLVFSDEYREIIGSITKDKSRKKDPVLEIERKIKIEEVLETENNTIDYYAIDQKIPIATKANIDEISEEVIKSVGKETKERIETLDKIESEEDVEPHKDSIISFMAYKENATNRERIISHYIDRIQQLDPKTIVECLKVMEDESEGKESKLYSIYLRLQEKRVIGQVQKYLIDLKYRKNLSDGKIEEFLQILEDQKTPNIKNENIDQTIEGISKNENRVTEDYLKQGRNSDFEMIRYIKKIDSEPQKEVLDFLQHRIINIRQLSRNESKENTLRKFIEQTSLKDENQKEQNKFLYRVAKIERDYLLERYGPVLDRYNELEEKENNPDSELKKLEGKLSSLEQKRKEAENLYSEYSKVMENTQEKEGGINKDD